MKMLFKGCPRCGGDVRVTSDIYGRYVQCIQCGHSADVPERKLTRATAAATSEQKTVAAA